MAPHSSTLAWKIPWMEEPYRLQSMGVGHDWATEQRRQWHPTPVLLPGKSHGQRSLVGCSPWGREESDTTERLHFHFWLSCIGEGNGNPLQCSCLENPRDGGAWWAAVFGVAQSRTRLKWLSSKCIYSVGLNSLSAWIVIPTVLAVARAHRLVAYRLELSCLFNLNELHKYVCVLTWKKLERIALGFHLQPSSSYILGNFSNLIHSTIPYMEMNSEHIFLAIIPVLNSVSIQSNQTPLPEWSASLIC